MNKTIHVLAFTISGLMATAAALAIDPPIPPSDLSFAPAHPPEALKTPQLPAARPQYEEEEASAEPYVGASAPPQAGTTLSPPVTITYTGSSNAVTITDSGTNRGLSSTLTNSGNTNSAVYGETKGKGAGVKGINTGTTGAGGVFQVTSSSSAQPALSASTAGTGSAITANVTKSSNSTAAIIAQNAGQFGTGVMATGDIGLYGHTSGGYGAYGNATTGLGLVGVSSSGTGSYGASSSGIGLYGFSSTNTGVQAFSSQGEALNASSSTGRGITAHSGSSLGIYASSDSSYGIWGQSKNQFGVIGEDSGSGVGVYGSSGTGYAGYFAGKVAATSYLTISDRNAKTDFESIDGSDILDRVSQLPITTWQFKSDPTVRHIGPVAQDFHAAFGLNGDDDTRINLVDTAGVSLAAIQELNKRLKEKDAQIAQMQTQFQAQLESLQRQFSERIAKLERNSAGSADIMPASR